MEKRILEELKKIEESENVKILYAVESGSRAWGFHSPDSDYDVRFIYVRNLDYYLQLNEKRDVIEWCLDEVLDINGWDLQKALKLLYKSNPTLFEWANSPIVYKSADEWQKIKELFDEFFFSKHSLFHYLSMAKGNFKEFLQGDFVKAKKYLYVLRPILACKWILNKHTPPPVLFDDLVKSKLAHEPEIVSYVNDILEFKLKNKEAKEIKKIEKLNEYIENNLIELETKIKEIKEEKAIGYEKLNEIFINTLKGK